MVEEVLVRRRDVPVGGWREGFVRAEHRGGASVEVAECAFGRSAVHGDVGVDEEQHVAARRAGAVVPGAGRARLARAGYDDVGELPGELEGGVERPVVDDDDLGVRGCARADRRDRGGQRGGRLEGGHDEGDGAPGGPLLRAAEIVGYDAKARAHIVLSRFGRAYSPSRTGPPEVLTIASNCTRAAVQEGQLHARRVRRTRVRDAIAARSRDREPPVRRDRRWCRPRAGAGRGVAGAGCGARARLVRRAPRTRPARHRRRRDPAGLARRALHPCARSRRQRHVREAVRRDRRRGRRGARGRRAHPAVGGGEPGVPLHADLRGDGTARGHAPDRATGVRALHAVHGPRPVGRARRLAGGHARPRAVRGRSAPRRPPPPRRRPPPACGVRGDVERSRHHPSRRRRRSRHVRLRRRPARADHDEPALEVGDALRRPARRLRERRRCARRTAGARSCASA